MQCNTKLYTMKYLLYAMSIFFQMSFQRAGVVGIDETQKIIAFSNSKTFVTDFNTPELAE